MNDSGDVGINDSTKRGLMWFEKSASGTDDFVYACMRNSASSFNWVMLARGD